MAKQKCGYCNCDLLRSRVTYGDYYFCDSTCRDLAVEEDTLHAEDPDDKFDRQRDAQMGA